MEFFDTIRYCTGCPKDLGPSRIIHFTSNLFREGFPVLLDSHLGNFKFEWKGKEEK
ncbi:hypothetical protein E2542_SST25571 [Spatholobus suberectus]|nr:hypothetical protein E2542_SST25571 [Spatholobus suberectus]